jgi:uncharacterized integral membrane protein
MKLPKMLRNLWVYRRLLALALMLGIALYFVAKNNTQVKVAFPFLGEIDSTSGIVMLTSAALGAVACWLVMTFRRALREARGKLAEPEQAKLPASPEHRRGTESEAKKTEGLPSAGP